MRRARFIEAAGLSIPGVVGTFVWGIIAGIAMIQSGMSVGQALGMTLIVFSGTAQLAAAAGVPFVRGGGGQPEGADWDGINRPIPGGLLWIMRGVDFAATWRHQQTAGDPKIGRAHV